MVLFHKIQSGNTIAAVGFKRNRQIPGPDHAQWDILKDLSPRKQAEWLASRELLSEIAGLPTHTSCLYDEYGKPYLRGSDRHISVSHSESWNAAMVSDKPCGVDIQVYTPTVERIAVRFLSDREIQQAAHAKDKLRHLHLLWGAKECIYKAYGKRQLRFSEHIFIRFMDAARGSGIGEIVMDDLHLSYEIWYRMLPEAAWVCCVECDRDDRHDFVRR